MNVIADIVPEFMHFNFVDSANLILLLGFILILGAIGGRLFQKLKIPQVVGYIVIGIIIGQSGFQILSSQVITALDPINSLALSLIGFLIGAELKTSVIKKYGKQFTGILLFESIVPFVVVSIAVTLITFFVTKDFVLAICLGLILGAISAATAPAATTDVLKENRTRGPLTTTVLGIVAMDDAVALILYAITSSIASNLLGGQSLSLGTQLLTLVYDIFGSILMGCFIGFILSLLLKNIMNNEGRSLSFSLGFLFLSTGICALINLDNILCSMAIGFFLVNFAPAKIRAVFEFIEKYTPPIYVLFFVLVGAKLNIWNVTSFLGIIAIVYVLCRTIGKTIGAKIGAKLTKAPITVYKYLPYCLLSQAGVAIGLSIAAGQQFQDTIGSTIMLIVTATTFIVQIIGPICVKYGVTKAEECGLDITEDDIMKQCKLSDVQCGGIAICDKNSPAIILENESLPSLINSFGKNHNQNYVVKTEDNKLAGIITLEYLKETLLIMDFYEAMMAEDIMVPTEIFVTPEMPIPEVMNLFTEHDVDALPILDKEGNVLGVAEKTAIEHYLHAKILEVHQKLAMLG